MSEKICPFMSGMVPGFVYSDGSSEPPYFEERFCKKEKCELWTAAYTAEGDVEYGCAFKINEKI